MAKGLAASIERIATITEGAPAGTWKRSKQRLSTLQTEVALVGGELDHRYFIAGRLRQQREVVCSSLTMSRVRIYLELARHWGGGDKLGKEFHSLHKTLEAESDVVEQSCLYQNNWDVTNTGIILVTLLNSRVQENETQKLPVLLWVSEFELMIRHPQSAVTVS